MPRSLRSPSPSPCPFPSPALPPSFERSTPPPTPPRHTSPPQLVALSPVQTPQRLRSSSLVIQMPCVEEHVPKSEDEDERLVLDRGDDDDGWDPDAQACADELKRRQRKRVIRASIKMAAVFVVSLAALFTTLYFAWPSIDAADKPSLRIPRSFEQLQELNALLKKYRDTQGDRLLVCWVGIYLFLQAFSLPGSMYLSILAGAVWGVWLSLPLCCAVIATGATLCYLISASLGGVLLALPASSPKLASPSRRASDPDAEPLLTEREDDVLDESTEEEKRSWFEKFREKVETYREKMRGPIERGDVWSYVILLRIAPFPPHWILNVVAPHLGINIWTFWAATFLGVAGMSVIHVTIGGGLDDMTSSADFHLFSWKNFFMLGGIVIAVLIPLAIRHMRRSDLDALAEEATHGDVDAAEVLAESPAEVVAHAHPHLHPEPPRATLTCPRSTSGTILLDASPAVPEGKQKGSSRLSPPPPAPVRRDSENLMEFGEFASNPYLKGSAGSSAPVAGTAAEAGNAFGGTGWTRTA